MTLYKPKPVVAIATQIIQHSVPTPKYTVSYNNYAMLLASQYNEVGRPAVPSMPACMSVPHEYPLKFYANISMPVDNMAVGSAVLS